MCEENYPAKLTLEMYNNIASYEWKESDVTVNDLIYAVYGLAVSHTYVPESIICAMKEFVESYEKTHGNETNSEMICE